MSTNIYSDPGAMKALRYGKACGSQLLKRRGKVVKERHLTREQINTICTRAFYEGVKWARANRPT